MPREWRDIMDNEIEELFVALSDETRRKILKVLDGDEEMNVTEIAAKFKLSRSNISHHLGILKRANILKSKQKGKENYYYINKKHYVGILRKYVEDIDKRCC